MKLQDFKGSIFAAKAITFTGKNAKPDKNQMDPVLFDVIAGMCPKNRVLNGTVAQSRDIVVGSTYLVSASLVNQVDYGLTIQFTVICELESKSEIIQTCMELGGTQLIEFEG